MLNLTLQTGGVSNKILRCDKQEGGSEFEKQLKIVTKQRKEKTGYHKA